MTSNLPGEWDQNDPLRDTMRPLKFDQWRTAIQLFPNKERYEQLLDILENEPDYWLYISW